MIVLARTASEAVVMLFALCCLLAGQQPPHCAQNLYCLFNQEASASDPAGIHKYSNDLIRLITPASFDKDFVELLGRRLTAAEEKSRTGGGKLVPEANVIEAFNVLTRKIGAPSIKADYKSLQKFREHAGKIFPALFPVARNGTKCEPDEAVFLLYLLISGNGTLSERDLDSAQIMAQESPKQEGRRSFGTAGMEVWDSSVSKLLESYVARHSHIATDSLFSNLADKLGF